MSLFICLIQTCLSQPLDIRTMIGQGEGKEIREEQIGDSHHKRQSHQCLVESCRARSTGKGHQGRTHRMGVT